MTGCQDNLIRWWHKNILELSLPYIVTHRDSSMAHRDGHLLSTVGDQAIADYACIMANAGCPLYHDLLRQIAQRIVHERDILQPGQRGSNVDLVGRPTRWLQLQGSIPCSASPTLACVPAVTDPSANAHMDKVSTHCADQFLKCKLGFKNVYLRYQETVRTAATTDSKLRMDFLRKRSNLVCAKHITQQDIWNCYEKGITMAQNNQRCIVMECLPWDLYL